MTIERDAGEFLVSCDRCSYSEYCDEREFSEVVKHIRHERWTIKSDPSQRRFAVYEHICPDCSEKDKQLLNRI